MNGYGQVIKCLKKLRIAAIMDIISVILIAVSLVASVIGLAAAGVAVGDMSTEVAADLNATDLSNVFLGAGASMIGAAVALIIGFILAVISMILELIGLIQGVKEDDNFRAALIVYIISLAVSVITTFLFRKQTSSAYFASNALSIAVIVGVCAGIRKFMERIGNEELLSKAKTILKMEQVVLFIQFALIIINSFTIAGGVGSIITAVLTIVFAVISIAAFFMYASLLRKARIALEKY